jgi:hypothetical protein
VTVFSRDLLPAVPEMLEGMRETLVIAIERQEEFTERFPDSTVECTVLPPVWLPEIPDWERGLCLPLTNE